ncbi:Maf family protein [Methylocaldum szegediense]|uniref:dTTP/UTP pyrophosphatase n=1 Tax=Methylocaldum szegediense TaxID=73780 RepID=A0ABM9HVY0_9GAMM|nr:Maf family protein [Methylocaldum szegediense]CAI8719978.1 nucleoside triphosphate pyrophosphatase YhdE [Methylocaldum szegediense]
MYTESPQIILASASPRRRELLDQLGISYDVAPAEIQEQPHPEESPEAYVQRVAAEKSLETWRNSGGRLPVLAADTAVVLDGIILGKPQDFEHALHMLSRLAGREHQVLSAVSLRQGDAHWEALNVSCVTFRPISRKEIEAYWATGEPRDKAGAYAIQGKGAIFVRHLSGSYSGVMGLPLFETAELLKRVGISVLNIPFP